MLKALTDLLGREHIVLGTDMPFDMADIEPLARLQRVSLDASQLGQVALGLFPR